MATALEISDQVVRHLAGEHSLAEFNIWLTRNTWNIHREEPQVRNLVGEIELALTEYSDRHLTEAELRRRLSNLISVQHVGRRETTSSSSASLVVFPAPPDAQAA
jgi:hypothetical protein